jgi:hypothetical protein
MLSRRPIVQVLCLAVAAVVGTGSGALADAPASHQGGELVPAQGTFAAAVTPPFQLEPRGASCELTVPGQLTFSGTLEGTAAGTTTALILAPCEEVAVTPPGTYFDVFRFEGEFNGTVADKQVTDADITYAGITRPGGTIGAIIRLSGDGTTAVLHADARVLVGGDYSGVALR